MDHDAYPIHEALQKGNHNIALQLLHQKPKDVTKTDADGRTPLHWAVLANDNAMVKAIIEDDAFAKWADDVIEAEDDSGWTPLHIAVANGNEELVAYLLDHGADVNATTSNGTTTLHLAVLKLPSVVPQLLAHKALFRPDGAGYTPLHRAAAKGSQPIITQLVEAKGASVIDKRDNDGWTALHHAMAEGHGEAAVQLIGLGADATIKSHDGESPHDVAAPKVSQYVYSCCGSK